MIQQSQLVPRYLLRKICEKNGVRLPKRPFFIEPQRNLLPAVYGPVNIQDYRRQKTVIETVIEREAKTLADKKFGFEKWEYRYWCVECGENGPTLAVCRACSSCFATMEPRRKHLPNDRCAKKLEAAYQLLQRDKRCIVCDTHTEYAAWGIPMCNSNLCRDLFMHEDTQSDALEKALLLVLAQQGQGV